jgi:hypothetical protein
MIFPLWRRHLQDSFPPLPCFPSLDRQRKRWCSRRRRLQWVQTRYRDSSNARATSRNSLQKLCPPCDLSRKTA